MKPLAINTITLTNFKNYSDASFQLGDKLNLVYGLNGTGKTNLLDAIYYLCVGKSYFTPFDHKVVRYGESFYRIEGNVMKDDTHTVVMKVRPGIQKELSVDGMVLDRISDHLGFMPVVLSAPKDIDLVIGPGQSRRKYIDHLLCQVDSTYLQALVAYNHLLQLRNAALRQNFDDLKRMIDTYDAQMGPHAAYIFEKRKWLSSNIQPLLQSTYKALSEGREEVSLTYESKLHDYVYEVLADMNWEADRNTGRSNSGIHRDDFHLEIKGMPAKEYGSQGQIKSLIFSLHLSKYTTLSEQCNYKPVLILDDIFDKLDEKRLARLVETLMQPTYGQILLSDTNRKRVAEYIPPDQLHEIRMEH